MDTSQKTPVSPAALPEPTPAPGAAPAPAVSTAAGAAAAPTQVRPRVALTTRAGAAVVGVSAGFIIAMLAVARDPSPRAVPAAENTQPDALSVPLAAPPVAAVGGAQLPKAVSEKPRQTRVVTSTKSLPADSARLPRASESAASGARESAAKTAVPKPTTSASAAQSNATPDFASDGAVTLTGCLEATTDGSRFRLTDTEGAQAPKARSWRSGFLNKRRAPVELVELPELSEARKYVGHRVAATGLLASRELRVRSLESAGSPCD